MSAVLPHYLITPRSREGCRHQQRLRVLHSTVTPKLVQQHANWVLLLASWDYVHKSLVGRYCKEAVDTLIRQDSTLAEDSIDLILQGMLQSSFGRMLLVLICMSCILAQRGFHFKGSIEFKEEKESRRARSAV